MFALFDSLWLVLAAPAALAILGPGAFSADAGGTNVILGKLGVVL